METLDDLLNRVEREFFADRGPVIKYGIYVPLPRPLRGDDPLTTFRDAIEKWMLMPIKGVNGRIAGVISVDNPRQGQVTTNGPGIVTETRGVFKGELMPNLRSIASVGDEQMITVTNTMQYDMVRSQLILLGAFVVNELQLTYFVAFFGDKLTVFQRRR